MDHFIKIKTKKMKIKKLFKSKTADFNLILIMLITLIAGLALIYAGYKLAVGSKEINDDKKCQLSFFAATQMSKVYSKSTKMMDVPVSLECPRHEVEIDIDKATVRRGKIIDDLVKAKIANEMMSCWSKTGAGKLDPSKDGGYVYSTDQRFCLICGEVTFSEKFQKLASKQNYEIKGLAYWAATRRVPGQKVTLFEWIGGKKLSDEKQLSALKSHEDSKIPAMDMTQKYAVLWRADVYKASSMAKFGAAVLAVGVLVAGVAVTIVSGGTAIMVGVAAATVAFGIGVAIEGSGGQARAEVHIVPMDKITDTNVPGTNKVYCSFMYN